jgi:hypothetical protein
MSTAYTFDATIARAPARRVPLFTPRFAEGSQRCAKAFARIFVMCAAVVTVVAGLLVVNIDNPTMNDRRCTLSANLHNSLVRPGVPPLAVERDWHYDRPPILTEPAGTSCADKQ